MKKGFNLLDLSVSLAIGALVLTIDQSVKIKEAQRQQSRNVGIEMYRFASAVTEYLHTDPRGVLNPGTNITFNGTSFLKRQGCAGSGSHSDGSALAFLPCDFPDSSTYGDLQFGLTIDVDAGGTVTAAQNLGDFEVAGNPEPLLASLSSFTASTFGGNTLRSGDFYIGLYSYLADYQFVPGSANIALRVEQTSSNNEALLVNGANTMNNNITFDDTLPATNRGINNIARLTSLAGGTGIIEIFSANFEVLASGDVSASGDITSGRDLAAAGDVFSQSLVDSNDRNYFVDPDQNSRMNTLESGSLSTKRIYDADNPSNYHLDPDSDSSVNKLFAKDTETESITITKNSVEGGSCTAGSLGMDSGGNILSCKGGAWSLLTSQTRVTRRTAPVTHINLGMARGQASCQAGETLVGGGCYIDSYSSWIHTYIRANGPIDENSWACATQEDYGSGHYWSGTATVVALCSQ